jgi:hypothetical protein
VKKRGVDINIDKREREGNTMRMLKLKNNGNVRAVNAKCGVTYP